MLENQDKTPNNDKIIIERLFPNVQWQKVNVKKGLPWFLSRSFAGAAALPGSYIDKTLSIVYRAQKGRMMSLGTFYHEAIHIQQYQDLDKKFPPGFGFFRAFMMHYLGWTIELFVKGILVKGLSIRKAMTYAYKENPLEIEAFSKEQIFSQTLYWNKDLLDLELIIQENDKLVIYKTEYKDSPQIWALILALIICLNILVIKPGLDLFFFLLEKSNALFIKFLKK